MSITGLLAWPSTSEQDRKRLAALPPAVRIAVAPNGVDVEVISSQEDEGRPLEYIRALGNPESAVPETFRGRAAPAVDGTDEARPTLVLDRIEAQGVLCDESGGQRGAPT